MVLTLHVPIENVKAKIKNNLVKKLAEMDFMLWFFAC